MHSTRNAACREGTDLGRSAFSPPHEQSIAVSIPEAARLLGVGRSWLYAAIRHGSIKKLKLGRRSVVLRAEIDRFLAGLSKQ